MAYRVLYVEDHDDTRVIVTILLERAGFEVAAVSCGSEALELARAGRFDLYLLDHTFSDASGITVCRGIREFDAGTPILFYSARAMEQEIEEALGAGAQGYLVKPLDIFNVAEHASRLIAEARRGREGGQ
ncbi:MAG TPA: response regulator [Pyrinomonadaceae bacterium]